MQPRYVTSQVSPLSLRFIHAHIVAGKLSRRQHLRNHLAEAGFEIEMASSASQAFTLMRKEPPAFLILCDDIDASPDALGVLRWLSNQEFRDSVHTLVLCNTTDSSRISALLRHGASDILPLDFSERELDERIQIAEHRSDYLRTRLADSRQLRQQATRYQKVVSHWPQAAILTPNLSRPIKEVNQRALEILGMTHDDVVGKYLSLILPDLFERDDFIPYEDFSKNPQRVEDVLYKSSDGEVLLEVRMVGMDWGKEGSILITFENVGRMQAIERSRSRVSQVESIRRFASEMAHEFNNILTIVNGNLSLLSKAETTLPGPSVQLITSSQQACRRATDLVKRLTKQRDFGQPKLAPVDAETLVQKASQEAVLSPRAQTNVTTADVLWPAIADADLLTEALKVLLKNADESLANSIIEVDIENLALGEETSLPLQSGDYLRITVLDQGPGMKTDVAERVFEPFFTTRKEAEGLGLTLALKIAEDHRGTLHIEDSPTGTGACFVLHIPADRASLVAPEIITSELAEEALAESASALSKEARKLRPAKVHTPRVLFMDDEPDIRTIVDKILSAHNFDITCTSSGEQAIDAYYRAIEEKRPYDVLLLDLEVVGGMGGKDTIAILRQDFPRIKAVVTTGYLDDTVLTNHREHGFSGVLTKPFQMEDLISVLTKLGGSSA